MNTRSYAGAIVMAFVCLAGCSAQKSSTGTPAATDQASLKTPTKDILVSSGDLNKPYDIVGAVEATLTGQSLYDTESSMDGTPSPDAANAAKDLLKKVAYTKYGDRVDAIINFKAHGGSSGGFGGAFAGAFGARTGVVQAEGIAVSFQQPAAEPPSKPATAPKKKK